MRFDPLSPVAAGRDQARGRAARHSRRAPNQSRRESTSLARPVLSMILDLLAKLRANTLHSIAAALITSAEPTCQVQLSYVGVVGGAGTRPLLRLMNAARV